ncbi:MAG TPA: hypothetical protein VHW70_03485 [Edaphobacter sp.]|jgi:hypothetical protein|nr:hypothetical protein [Edaphobacter sp.]
MPGAAVGLPIVAAKAVSTSQPVNDEEYRVAYAVAEDNLCLGRTLISDSVNPIQLSHHAIANAWKLDQQTYLD